MATLAAIGRAALDLLYPPKCSLCGSGGTFLCDACRDGLPVADGYRCQVCWLPMRGTICFTCREHVPAFSALRSASRYQGEVRTLVHAFKYGGQSCLAPYLAAPMVETWLQSGLSADVIVAVPMTGLRRRQRGYNQAMLLARELGRELALPVAEALRRRHFAGNQAGSRSAVERRRNVEGAFSVSRPADVAGRRVLLVDDIATTGATLDACAGTLRQAGVLDVAALTLARED